MSKKKQNEDELLRDEREFNITAAQIKDGFCHYTFEILRGIGEGDTHNVKGSGLVKDDMLDAFARFNVHMAVIDDAFKNSGTEIDDIDNFHNHELTANYHVSGFKIKGSEDNESIVLTGTKYVQSVRGRVNLETPKIPLDSLSSYHWYNELKTAADKARQEVELYKGGKYTPVEVEQEIKPKKEKFKQLTIADGAEPAGEETENVDETFAEAEL